MKQSTSKLEKNEEGLFFSLTEDILKKQMSEPKPLTFMDEMRAKLDKITKELSCQSKPDGKQPVCKPEPFDAAILESIGSQSLSHDNAPTTPRIRHLNEDGEYE